MPESTRQRCHVSFPSRQIPSRQIWRAIRYDTTDFKSDPARFAIHRGTAMPLDDDCFLIWTYGCIQHDDSLGSGYNYYKGGRGIPSPLLVKRFYGKASGDVLANHILMLSKMNWNSGDSLYKQLPVTLDFAKYSRGCQSRTKQFVISHMISDILCRNGLLYHDSETETNVKRLPQMFNDYLEKRTPLAKF